VDISYQLAAINMVVTVQGRKEARKQGRKEGRKDKQERGDTGNSVWRLSRK